jgi:hypothetical protein
VYGVQIAGIRIRGLIADTLIFWFWYGLLVCVYGVQILGKLLFLNPPIKQLVKHWADLRSFFLIEKIRGGLLSSSIVHRSPEWRDWIYFLTSTVLLCNPYFDAFALLGWATSVKFLPRILDWEVEGSVQFVLDLDKHAALRVSTRMGELQSSRKGSVPSRWWVYHILMPRLIPAVLEAKSCFAPEFWIHTTASLLSYSAYEPNSTVNYSSIGSRCTW